MSFASATAPIAAHMAGTGTRTHYPHGWGHDAREHPGAALTLAAERPGANLNAVLDARARDPLSGNSVLSGAAVSLSRCTHAVAPG